MQWIPDVVRNGGFHRVFSFIKLSCISGLLAVNGKFHVALEVLQLCLKLLPVANREELYRLLSFMSLAADPQHARLHKEVGRVCIYMSGFFVFNTHSSDTL